MKITHTLTFTSVLALFAGPALADLTAEEVLADQLRQMSSMGLIVSTTGESRSGDTLSVEGLEGTAEIPEGAFSFTFGGADIVEQGDGTVALVYPDTMPVTFSGVSADGERFAVEMTLTQEGFRQIASGTPDQIRYEYAADRMAFGDIKITEPAEAEAIDLTIDITATGMSGFTEFSGSGDARDYTSDFAVATISMLLEGSDPEGEQGQFSFTGAISDIKGVYEGVMAGQDIMDSFAQAIQKGNRTKGTASHGALSYQIAGSGPEGEFQANMGAASGDFSFSLDEAGLDYGGTTTGIEMNLAGSIMPLPPVSLSIAETGGRLKMPVVPSEDPQDFAMRMSMVGLEVDPILWSMIDPGEQLPRDPATIVIDLDGEVVMLQDVFAPEFAEQPMTAPPGQINALNVNELRLSFAGAELTGDADFAFNNDMGMPVPSGVANLMLVGANGLIDTLVQMGLVPQDQAMGARMMMGMFARPGDGPDTLISTIQVNEDGSILANGQRIK